MTCRQFTQTTLQTLTKLPHLRLHAFTLHLANAGQRGGRTDAVSPVTAGDEAAVRRVHHGIRANDGTTGDAVAHGLGIHGDVRLNAKPRTCAGETVAPAAGDFIDDVNGTCRAACSRHVLQKAITRHLRTHRLHDDCREIATELDEG